MSDFLVVHEATFPPNHCAVCLAHNGRFIDTLAELIGEHIYLCENCVRAAAVRIGCRTPDTAEATEQQLEEALCRITDLEDELAAERANKTVSLSDARELILEAAARQPARAKRTA